jgi:hypothetical protein
MKIGEWVLVDYGVKNKVRQYLQQGYIVVFGNNF